MYGNNVELILETNNCHVASYDAIADDVQLFEKNSK
jgi:hypothetical protein